MCGQGVRPAGVRRWARPHAGRAGEGSRASEARAPVSALCDAAAGVARSGWLTMDYRSKRTFEVGMLMLTQEGRRDASGSSDVATVIGTRGPV